VIPPTPRAIGPDLALGAPLSTIPTVVYADQPFTLQWLTCNQGSHDAESSHDSLFLDAAQVDEEPRDRLEPGQCWNASHTFPDGLSAGHHQFMVYLDVFNEIVELDESNNSPEWNIFVH
jgi:subtilase family serine protease